ncbi:MAG: LPS-assembly protein LptD [Deltaproteobacteria bacterium]|nr:MAG: LPS-assembly protein LptD [Deltaproteobacteria bacterium]
MGAAVLRGGDRRPSPAVVAAALCVIVLGAAAVRAGETIDVEAGSISYEAEGQVVQASGGVVARWADKTLRAGALRFERESGKLRAEGGIVLETPRLTLRAASCDLDVDDETGILRNVSLTSKTSDARFGGKTVEKRRGSRYALERGYFTTCREMPGHPPDWELAGRRVKFKVDGTGTVRDGTFRVRGVPLLYIPYMRFPAGVRRQSGLLMPRVGLSNERGFIYSQPFFWAIDKHKDATFTADLETAARVGGQVELRYRPRRDVDGRIEVAAYNEHIRGNARTQIVSPQFAGRTIPENRAMLEVSHRQGLGEDSLLYLDTLLVSDDLLLREAESVASRLQRRSARRSLRYTDSRLGVLSHHGFTTLGARTRVYQDFFGADRLTVQRPLELWLQRDGDLGAGVGYAVDATLSSFYRPRGYDGQRVDVVTQVERALTSYSPIRANAWARGRLTAYRMNDQTVVDDTGQALGQLSPRAARALAEGGVEVKTVLSRRFQVPAFLLPVLLGERSDSGQAWEHTIEPFARLRATTNSTADLPLYDEVDRIDGRSVATYGLASRFLLDDDRGAAFETLRLSAEQSYNFDEQVLDDHFSDIDFTLSLRSRWGLALRGLASYNVGDGRLMGAASALSLEGIRLPWTKVPGSRVQAVYRFVRGEVLETAEGRAILALSEHFSVGLNGRFDFVGSTFVESGGGIRYRSGCGCWAIDVGVLNRVNPDELQLRVEVELAGLGSLGSSPLFKTSRRLAALYGVDRGYRRYGW